MKWVVYFQDCRRRDSFIVFYWMSGGLQSISGITTDLNNDLRPAAVLYAGVPGFFHLSVFRQSLQLRGRRGRTRHWRWENSTRPICALVGKGDGSHACLNHVRDLWCISPISSGCVLPLVCTFCSRHPSPQPFFISEITTNSFNLSELEKS